MNKKRTKEETRAEIIIHELRCGGFALSELEEMQDVLIEEIENKEEEGK